ncbi:hypothetical protein EU522_00590 [Candidatus Thorarchaeota archaeon]|nr:MAG: hypothetical protein EU522_00590 [Candidatus Thorarchaeota archaeon]
MTSCIICGRPAQERNRFCKYHQSAFEALTKTYEEWNKAFGGIEWYEYLKEVLEAEGTGLWVNEVVEIIRKESAP